MQEEYRFAENPEMNDLIESFRIPRALAMVTCFANGKLYHIPVAVHGIEWVDQEERRQMDFRGLTVTGRHFRASIRFDNPERSGIVLDPDD